MKPDTEKGYKCILVELSGLIANPSTEPFIQVVGGLAKELVEAKPARRRISSPTRRHHVHLGSDEMAALVSGYQEGATTKELAEIYGIHHTTVSIYLKRAGVSLRYKLMSPDEVARAKELYESGLSLVQVSRKLGPSHNTIRRELLAIGVVMRDPHGRERH